MSKVLFAQLVLVLVCFITFGNSLSVCRDCTTTPAQITITGASGVVSQVIQIPPYACASPLASIVDYANTGIQPINPVCDTETSCCSVQ